MPLHQVVFCSNLERLLSVGCFSGVVLETNRGTVQDTWTSASMAPCHTVASASALSG